jgi:tetratricopeptide (TPR) repeat protein
MEYVFHHALVRDATYATLSEEDCRLGHRLAAAWLEKAGEADAAMLAEHLARGGEPARALGFNLRAAEQALEGNDFAAALDQAKRGIAGGAEGELRGELLLVQAEANKCIGRNIEAEACASDAMRLLPRGSSLWFSAVAQLAGTGGRIGKYDRLAPLSQELLRIEVRGAPTAYVIAAARVAFQLFSAGQAELGGRLLAAAEAAMESARGADPVMAALVAQARGMRSLLAGDLAAVLSFVKDAAEHFERAGAHRSAIGERVNIAHAYIELGAYAQAEAVLRDVLAKAERMGLGELSAGVRHNLALVLAYEGALDEALALLTTALEAALAHSSRQLEGLCRTYRALILLRARDAAGSEQQARAAVEIPTLAPPMRAYAFGTLSRALLAQQRAAEALDAAEKAMALMSSPAGVEEGEFPVHVARIEALLASDRVTEATNAIAAARERLLARAAQIGDPVWRESFLTRVTDNARILSLARTHLGADSARRSNPPTDRRSRWPTGG